MADKRITLYHCFSWDEADYLDRWLQMRISEGLWPVEIGFFSAKFEEKHGRDRRYILLQMHPDCSYNEREKIQESGWVQVPCGIGNILCFYTEDPGLPVPDADKKKVDAVYDRKQKNLIIGVIAVVMAVIGSAYEIRGAILSDPDGTVEGIMYFLMSASVLILTVFVIALWIWRYNVLSSSRERRNMKREIDEAVCVEKNRRNKRVYGAFSAAVLISILLFLIPFLIVLQTG